MYSIMLDKDLILLEPSKLTTYELDKITFFIKFHILILTTNKRDTHKYFYDNN